MVAFGGVARALRCAVDIQRGVSAHEPPSGTEPIAVHIGVHTGDAVDEGDDYLGHTVIVASRLADAAGPGEILVSSLSGAAGPGVGGVRLRRRAARRISRAWSAHSRRAAPVAAVIDAELWEQVGLYDPLDPASAERLALLEYLTERGATVEQMVEAHRMGTLPSVAGNLVTQGRTPWPPSAPSPSRAASPCRASCAPCSPPASPPGPTPRCRRVGHPDGGLRARWNGSFAKHCHIL